jgi:hypothetical protein
MSVVVTYEADSAAELQEMIDNYLYHYPRLGYDTRVDSKYYDDSTKKYVAKLSRLKSCD